MLGPPHWAGKASRAPRFAAAPITLTARTTRPAFNSPDISDASSAKRGVGPIVDGWTGMIRPHHVEGKRIVAELRHRDVIDLRLAVAGDADRVERVVHVVRRNRRHGRHRRE